MRQSGVKWGMARRAKSAASGGLDGVVGHGWPDDPAGEGLRGVILSDRHVARKPFEEWESLGKGLVQRVFRRIGLQRLL